MHYPNKSSFLLWIISPWTVGKKLSLLQFVLVFRYRGRRGCKGEKLIEVVAASRHHSILSVAQVQHVAQLVNQTSKGCCKTASAGFSGKCKHEQLERGSERRISQHRLAKNFRTSKVSFKLIRTSKVKKIRTSKVTSLWRLAFFT